MHKSTVADKINSKKNGSSTEQEVESDFTSEMLYTLGRLNSLQLLTSDMSIIYDLINLTRDIAELSSGQETVQENVSLDDVDSLGIM